MWRMQLARIFKYGVTGVLNTGVSYAVSTLLIMLGSNVNLGWAGGYVVGMATSYLVNSLWTFTQQMSLRASARFFAANIMVLLLSEGTLSILLHNVTPSPYLAQAINLVLVVVIGYILNQCLVFRPSRAS